MSKNCSNSDTARLIISCPDKKGIVAKVSNILFQNGGNIIESAQHSALGENPQFFMRIVFEIEGLFELKDKRKKLEEDVMSLASSLDMSYDLNYLYKLKKMAIFVSKLDHCLNELLWLWKSEDIKVEIPLIISNHKDLKSIADFYGIPFFEISPSEEDKMLSLLKHEKIDFVVLARYMQILSSNFLKSFGKKVVNIHHSFLPSFPGAKPYEKAFEKGVKIIGATAHFVNEELDGGPIIEQDVIRINHDDDIDAIKRKGKIIEKIVLSKAVKWFVEDRVIQSGNKTIVFE